MPYQDQLHIGYVPTDWADFQRLMAELGKMTPVEPDLEFIDEELYDQPLGSITVEGGRYDVSVQRADWDGGPEEEQVLKPHNETNKLWIVVGLQMTNRYRGEILDSQFKHGRPDFFEIDMPRCMKFKEQLDIFLKRPTTLVWVCHFY